MAFTHPWAFMGIPMAGMAEHLPDPPAVITPPEPTPLELHGPRVWCERCQVGGRDHDHLCWSCGEWGHEEQSLYGWGADTKRGMTMHDLLGEHDLEPLR